MSVDVIAHDTRLEGNTPSATASAFSFEVDGDTPIQDFFDRCRSIAVESGGIGDLNIMAHGIELMFGGELLGGGYGITFCRELITLENTDLFALLADKVRHINLYVCAAADVSPDVHHLDVRHPETAGVWRGDGNELCRQIAIRAQCTLTAATEIQAYSGAAGAGPPILGHSLYTFGDMDFGEWEGPIVTYDANGNITDRQVFPSAWRTSDGEVHDPRIESRPPGI